jgi:5-methylcytosine-specific restriction enzyme A
MAARLRYPWQPAPGERRAQVEKQRGTSTQRGYDAAWRAVRKQFLAKNARCVHCGALATEADHIQSIADRPDLRLNWSNLRALCKPCHSRRTATEQGFARKR